MAMGVCLRTAACVVLLMSGLVAAPAGSQIVIEQSTEPAARVEGIRPEGLIVELGLAAPSHGDTGLLYGISAGMGTFLSRHLDFSLGLRHWSADIDRSSLGASTRGTFSDTSLDAVLTYPLLRMKGLRPYFGVGMAGHSVGADVPGDRSLEDALSGINVGALTVLGIGTTKPGLGFRLQLRRDFVEDVGAWTYALGAGWWPKARAARAGSTVRVGSSSSVVEPRAVTVTRPTALAATPASPEDPALADIVTALNHLKAENAALTADVSSLKERLAVATPVAPMTQPNAIPTPAPRVEPPVDRSDRLFDALDRVTAMNGHPESLRRMGDSGLLTLDQSLLFATGQSQLATGAREELRRLAVVLLRFPEASLVVQGHTDAVGQAAANLALSERRAAAVRAELLSIGLAPDRVAAVGFGDTRPVATNDTPAGRARNRRVDLLITVPEPVSN